MGTQTFAAYLNQKELVLDYERWWRVRGERKEEPVQVLNDKWDRGRRGRRPCARGIT